MKPKRKKLEQTEQAVSPVIAVILMVAITVVLAAVLYVWAASFMNPQPNTPLVTATVAKRGDGNYEITVIKVTAREDLETYQWFLKDENRITSQFDVVGLRKSTVGSEAWIGADITWDSKTSERASTNGGAYANASAAQARIDEVKAGQDGAGNPLSVKFYDNDFDGKLSSGDTFIVRGNEPDHPATDDYYFELKYTLSDDTAMLTHRLGT